MVAWPWKRQDVQGFNRLLGVFEQSRTGWLTDNIEESRRCGLSRAASRRLRYRRRYVFTSSQIDRSVNDCAKSPASRHAENVPVTFQIWDVTRLKRIQAALSVRDDLVVDFSDLEGGGLHVQPASVGSGEYDGYLAVIPGEVLAGIYIRHGSRLLEGNVRTFLGRSGNMKKGIASTVAKEPTKFFAYNNGIAATASAVRTVRRGDGSIILTSATDLQIVNGAQTTASLASAGSERRSPAGACLFR